MCIIAIDYDGTITADFEQARTAIEALKMEGHVIVIWSSRNNPLQHGEKSSFLIKEMKESLDKYRIPYDKIDMGEVGKFHANVYVDDKAITFKNNWAEILKQIY